MLNINNKPSIPFHGITVSSALSYKTNLVYIRNCAIKSLWYELITFPKPGLVSLVDSGSHADMNAKTFYKSILTLRHFFYRIAALGLNKSSFEALRLEGIAAEKKMLASTGGVNTHRGAIFILGMLSAASAYHHLCQSMNHKTSLGAITKLLWQDELLKHKRISDSNGAKVESLYKFGGALEEACSGFPSVYNVGLPVYRSVLKETSSFYLARIQTFFALMAHINDTNLIHRGGLKGLNYAKSIAGEFLHTGGIYSDAWEQRAKQFHQDFIKMRLSPGGSADLLGACIFIHLVEIK